MTGEKKDDSYEDTLWMTQWSANLWRVDSVDDHSGGDVAAATGSDK